MPTNTEGLTMDAKKYPQWQCLKCQAVWVTRPQGDCYQCDMRRDRFYLRDNARCTEIRDSDNSGEVVAYVKSSRIAVEACAAMNRGEDYDFARFTS